MCIWDRMCRTSNKLLYGVCLTFCFFGAFGAISLICVPQAHSAPAPKPKLNIIGVWDSIGPYGGHNPELYYIHKDGKIFQGITEGSWRFKDKKTIEIVWPQYNTYEILRTEIWEIKEYSERKIEVYRVIYVLEYCLGNEIREEFYGMYTLERL